MKHFRKIYGFMMAVMVLSAAIVWTNSIYAFAATCSICGGTGKTTCVTCGGSGSKTVTTYQTLAGGITVPVYSYNPCSYCAGTGKISCIHCGGEGKVSDSENSDITSYSKSGYLNSTATASTKYVRDNSFDETKNPGFHINFKQSEYTIDLNGNNTAKIEYYLTVPNGYTDGMKNFYVCDLPDNDAYLKWKAYSYGKSSGEGYTSYTGLKTGTTSVHVWVRAGDCFQHHEIKINIIDSSKTSASTSSSSTSKNTTEVKKGASIKVSGNTYVVTGTNTVTFKKVNSKTIKSISIPATIKYKGKIYKVTAIAAKAFYKYTKLTCVTIGKNIKSLGASAFFGCKKLSKITIKSSALTSASVGANAFKGVNAKAIISVPKAKKAAYKKFLYKKGLGTKATIK